MIQRQRPTRQTNILAPIFFLFLVFVVAVAGAYLVLQIFGSDAEGSQIPQIITVEVIITATPLPTKLATVLPAIAQRPRVNLPADIAAETGAVAGATLDPFLLGARDVPVGTDTGASGARLLEAETCRIYALVSGDTPYGVAIRYDVDFNEILAVNDLTIDTSVYLQVGDTLRIPLAPGGCTVDSVSDTVTAESAPVQPEAPAATSTPPSAQFELAEVEGLGDITAEAIKLRNIGATTLNISDWTLSDGDGNTFTFFEMLVFPDVSIAIYTRSGASSSDALFWGRDQSVWEAGEEITLRDEQGRVLQTLQIPPPADA